MENVVREPVELTDAELDQVAGGFLNTATAVNVGEVLQEQSIGNRGFLSGNLANVGLQVGILTQIATAIAL